MLLRGPAYKGHPWPFKPLAASMRLVPLRNTSSRPPDGESGSEVPVGFSLRCALLIVPTLCVGMLLLALRVSLLWVLAAESSTRSIAGWVPTRNVGTIDYAGLSGSAKRPLQEAERNHCVRG